LKSDKSPGHDGLNPLVQKEAAAQFCIPLSMSFRKLFGEGLLPDDWKRANIVPEGESSNPGNYRLISLTIIVCKVFEAIVTEHIMKQNNSLSNS